MWGGDPRSGTYQLTLAVVLPLLMLAIAYTLSAISNRLIYIGPLDRATFGWVVVMPIAWLAPGVAGLAWARLTAGQRRLAALLLGGAVAAVSTILLATNIDQVGCSPVTSWTDDLPGSLIVGAVIGAGPATGALLAATVARRTSGVWGVSAAIATGAVVGIIGLFLALMVLGSVFPVVSCVPSFS